MNALQKEQRREQRKQECNKAYDRAVSNPAWSNYLPVIKGFMEKGIAQQDIIPKENVFTFKAWKALGRYVRKGEKGVKIPVWRPTERESTVKQYDENENEIKGNGEKHSALLCCGATVFHISQTEQYKA